MTLHHRKLLASVLTGALLTCFVTLAVAGEAPTAKAKKGKFGKVAKAVDPAPAPAKSTGEVKPPLQVPAQALSERELARLIDQHIDQRLAAAKIPASPRSDDVEFLRRIYLDLAGVIPPVEVVKAMLDSTDPNRRHKLIDDILNSDRYAFHMADLWSTRLFQRINDNRAVPKQPLQDWLKESFARNDSWHQIVTTLLTATGGTDDPNAGATIYTAANFGLDKLTNTTTRLFMGVRLECAQCHNHPFTNYKQTDYWHMAAFFSKVRLQGNPAANAKNATPLTVTESGKVGRGKAPPMPEGAKALAPKFLNGPAPTIAPEASLREVLAKWLTTKDNPFFARATVNRVWGQMFGRGLVNPVDDMHDDNPPTHPELLDALAGHFAAANFDLKYLYRAIALSETYQRTSKTLAGNEKDDTLYSHMAVKVMTPEQLFDSLNAVLGSPRAIDRKLPGLAAGKGVGIDGRTLFVNFFAVDENADVTEYQQGIPQALKLMNGARTGKLPTLAGFNPSWTPSQVIEHIYLTALSRRPTAQEMSRLLQYVSRDSDRTSAYGDILWAVINSSEFTLVR